MHEEEEEIENVTLQVLNQRMVKGSAYAVTKLGLQNECDDDVRLVPHCPGDDPNSVDVVLVVM